MAQQLKILQEDLQAAKLAAQRLKESAAQVQQRERTTSQQVATSESKSVEANGQGEKKPFLKEVSDFKQQTPAKQREMKKTIQELFEEITRLQEELDVERELKEQAEDDVAIHEAQAAALDVQTRKLVRNSSGLDRQLKELVSATGASKTKTLSTGVKSMFRSETPARQREMKEQIKHFLDELDVHDGEVSKEHASHAQLRMSRGQVGNGSGFGAFAFGSGDGGDKKARDSCTDFSESLVGGIVAKEVA